MDQQFPAASAIYARHVHSVHARISRIVRDREAALDLTHDVFEAAFKALGNGRLELEAVKPWLLTVAFHRAIDHLRSRQRTAAEEPARIERHCESEHHRREMGAHWGDATNIHAALQELTVNQRQVIALRYLCGETTPDTARLLGKRAATIRQLEHRALETVRQRIRR